MTQIRPDNVILTSLIDTYINYDTLTTDVVISGNVANGATANFTGTIPYSRAQTRADLYATNLTTGIKRPISGGPRSSPYTFVSTETCSQTANYDGTNITVIFSVFNGSGGAIVLTTQTLRVSAVLYEVPY